MKNKFKFLIGLVVAVTIVTVIFLCKNNKKSENKIKIFEQSKYDLEQLETNEVIDATQEDEQKVETQTVEDESFEEQGNIAYNGAEETPHVLIGDTPILTYYSQLDSRWRYDSYTSINNSYQNIGTSGCGPTAAAMAVTACKGAITPDQMASLYVNNGFRSANSGTYFSAFKWTADIFNIEFEQTYSLDRALELMNNDYYVVASCGNGLFTYGGHYIVLTKIDNNTISIYDPYLYAGKFETSSRRGKATVQGTTVYCSVDNFKNYANATHFFCYKHNENIVENKAEVIETSSYTRYVNVQTKLNVRNAPNGNIIGTLSNNTKVEVSENDGTWSKIGDNQWVSSLYLVENKIDSSPIYEASNNQLGLYMVTATKLNVRSGAGTNYKIKKSYSRGTRFDTYEIKNNWAKTPSGWVCLDYCKLIRKY